MHDDMVDLICCLTAGLRGLVLAILLALATTAMTYWLLLGFHHRTLLSIVAFGLSCSIWCQLLARHANRH